EKALQTEMRRMQRDNAQAEEVEVDVDEIDMSKIITEVYEEVYQHYQDSDEQLRFDHLLPDNAARHDKVYTFMPLLHLDNQRNVNLQQDENFGPITIEFLQELEGDFYAEQAT
ncbi:MAG: segregation/condensation protein A, partial [Halobacteriaceae archaeon]